jgi:DDE domain
MGEQGSSCPAFSRRHLKHNPPHHQKVVTPKARFRKVRGQDQYLYRAVDSTGRAIDFLLTAKPDAASAKRLLRKVFGNLGECSTPRHQRG